jgi:hypothetical protein
VTAQEKLFTAQTEKRQKAYFAKKKRKKARKSMLCTVLLYLASANYV